MVSTFPVQDSGKSDKGEKRGGEFLIAGGNAAMLLNGSEEVLDPVALAVEATVKVPAGKPLSAHGKAREDMLLVEEHSQSIRVIALISHQDSAGSPAESLHQLRRAGDVRHIARAQNELDCPASSIHQRVNLSRESAAAWSHRLRLLTSGRDWQRCRLPAHRSCRC